MVWLYQMYRKFVYDVCSYGFTSIVSEVCKLAAWHAYIIVSVGYLQKDQSISGPRLKRILDHLLKLLVSECGSKDNLIRILICYNFTES